MFKIIEASSAKELSAKMTEHMTQVGQALLGTPFYAEGMFYQAFRTEMNVLPDDRERTTDVPKPVPEVVPKSEEPAVEDIDPLEATYGKAGAAAWRLSRTGPREYLMEQVGIVMDLAEGGNFSTALDIYKALMDKYSVNELVREFPELDALVFGLLGRRPGGSRTGNEEAGITHVKKLVADLRRVTKMYTSTPTTKLIKSVLDVPECEYNRYKRERDAGATEAGAPEGTFDRLVRADEEVKGVKTPADVLNLILGAVHDGFPAVALYCARQLTGRGTEEIYKGAIAKYGPHFDSLIFGLLKRECSPDSPSRVERILEDLYAAHPEFRPTISLTKEKK